MFNGNQNTGQMPHAQQYDSVVAALRNAETQNGFYNQNQQ
jgi:hypothetical protein